MKKKPNNLPKKQVMKLKDNHSWTAPQGHKIVVLDRGAVSFNIPESWHLEKLEPLELYDKAPPDDNARLSVSFWRLPPGIDWSGLPLASLLTKSIEDNDPNILETGKLMTIQRSDIEIVWTYRRFLDQPVKREAFSRIAVARGFDVQMLMTFDFWVDELSQRKPVWDEALRSLQLGRHIEDPTRGVIRH